MLLRVRFLFVTVFFISSKKKIAAPTIVLSKRISQRIFILIMKLFGKVDTTKLFVVLTCWNVQSCFAFRLLYSDAANGMIRSVMGEKQALPTDQTNRVPRSHNFLANKDARRSLQQDECSSKLSPLSDCLTTTYGCDANCVMEATQTYVDYRNYTCANFKSHYCSSVAACGCRTCQHELTDYYSCSGISDCDYQCPSSSSDTGGGSVSMGLIIGIVGGTLILLCLVTAAAFCFFRRKSKPESNNYAKKAYSTSYETSSLPNVPQFGVCPGSPVVSMPHPYATGPFIAPETPQPLSCNHYAQHDANIGRNPVASRYYQQQSKDTPAGDRDTYQYPPQNKINTMFDKNQKSIKNTESSQQQQDDRYFLRPPAFTPTAKDQCRTVLAPTTGEPIIVEATPVPGEESSASLSSASSNLRSAPHRSRLDP